MTAGGALWVALLFQNPVAGTSAVSEGGPTRARLELRGAADCLARSDLAARVTARSPRIQFVEDAPVYASVVLTSTRPGNVVAELVLAPSGAEQPPRRFLARTCAEAADAIAVIIAVTLDPTLRRKAAGEGEGGARAGDASGGTSPASGEAGTAPGSPPADQGPAVPPPPPPATVEAPAPPAPVPAVPPSRHFGAYVVGETIFGPAPAVMPGVALYAVAALDREGLWAPALFIGATHAWRSGLAEPGGTASFMLDAATVDACPLRLGAGSFVARPCASALIGRLAASGSDTQQPSSEARPFGVAGAAVSASFGETVQLHARLGVGMTLLRDTYDFMGPTFHRAGRITTTASLGVGLRWH